MKKLLLLLCCLSLFAVALNNEASAKELKNCTISCDFQVDFEKVLIKQKDPLIFIFSVSGEFTITHNDGTKRGPEKYGPKKFEVTVTGKTIDTFTENDLVNASNKAKADASLEASKTILEPECQSKSCPKLT